MLLMKILFQSRQRQSSRTRRKISGNPNVPSDSEKPRIRHSACSANSDSEFVLSPIFESYHRRNVDEQIENSENAETSQASTSGYFEEFTSTEKLNLHEYLQGSERSRNQQSKQIDQLEEEIRLKNQFILKYKQLGLTILDIF